MLDKSNVKTQIHRAQLDAEFRENCGNQWNDLLKKVSEVPTHYLEHLVDYQSSVFRFISKNLIDISLILYLDNKVCGVWPLFLDANKKEPIKSINDNYGGIVVPPLFIENLPKKSERRIIKACINFLSSLVNESNGKIWRTSDLSANANFSQWHQLCLEAGADLDKVCYEQYVDLSLSTEQLRKFYRKSYKPLISSGLKKWHVTVLDKYCDTTWNNFRSLHKKVSGRVTRPIESWNIQHQAIKDGNAFLVYVSNSEGEMIGGGFFDMSINEGNYSVACYNKDFTDQPLGHIVQNQAIVTLKKKRRSLYYLGSRFYREELPEITKKLVDISSFKAGFSSFLLPRVVLMFKSKITTEISKKR